MSPNFPATAQVVAELYPQSGGQEIDGVISLDVFALEQLVGLVGPLEPDSAPKPLTADNTAQFLLVDQYFQTDVEQRVDMLESVARTTIERLLGVAPAAPLELGKALAPLIEQRRVLAWAPTEGEKAVLTTASMDGALLSGMGAADAQEAEGTAAAPQGVAVTVVNASGNKIDSFLERDYEYVRGPAGDDLRLSLTNTAPASGYPDYVIGNLASRPTGRFEPTVSHRAHDATDRVGDSEWRTTRSRPGNRSRDSCVLHVCRHRTRGHCRSRHAIRSG